MTPYLTVPAVAALLSVSHRTVYDWCREKKLAHFKVGRIIRFSPAVVDAFIAERTTKAKFAATHGQGLGHVARESDHSGQGVSRGWVARGDVAAIRFNLKERKST